MPPLPPMYEWFLQAFWDLSTERQIGMGAGPIPLSKVEQMAERHQLTEENAETLRQAVRAMDREYLKHVTAKQKQERESGRLQDQGRSRR